MEIDTQMSEVTDANMGGKLMHHTCTWQADPESTAFAHYNCAVLTHN